MKKLIILIILAITVTFLVKNKSDNVYIPSESIRIRIIANSNSEYDIKEKISVKKNVEKELSTLLTDANNIEEAREIINNNMERLNIVIEDTTEQSYKVNFGNNYFPSKTYKGVIYENGIYESLVVTLGDGIGDNWWCVLFPPLCLLEGTETENTTDVEYRFFVKELIDKYLK